MFRSLCWRLIATYLAVVLLSMTLLGVYLGRSLEDLYMESLRSRLESNGRLAAQMAGSHLVGTASEPTFEALATRVGKLVDARVTFVALDGTVLGDSEEDASSIENHGTRPEVVDAFEKGIGTSIRYSTTVKMRMMNVAVPIEVGGKAAGVARLAVPLTEVNAVVVHLWTTVAVAGLLTLALAGALALRLAGTMVAPIKDMTDVAQAITRGNLDRRIPVKAHDEIGILGSALNHMASTIKESLAEISEEKSKLETVLANMVSGVLLVDDEGKVTLVNQAAEKILSLEGRKALGRPYVEAVRNYELITQIDEVLSAGHAVKKELSLIFPEDRSVEAYLAPIPGYRAETTGAVVVLHDITNLKRLERVRAEFVGNVSHELKTPLTALKGFSETLVAHPDNPETVAEFADIIRRETDRLCALVNDLLELSKLESGKVQMVRRQVDLKDLARDAARRFETRAEKAGVALQLVLPEGAVQVPGDPDRLDLVLNNLLDNAIKFTPRGGRIELGVTEREMYSIMWVADTGIGIPREDQSRVFERFYRVDKARSRKLGGTGLGLSIVKHIVEAHRGKVTVSSEPAKGSRFEVVLPRESVT